MSKRKEPDDNVNSDFYSMLMELANYEKNVNNDMHRSSAYRKAASTLAHHPTRITSGAEARKLKGIGPKIADKIEEFIKTGGLEKLKKIRQDDTPKIIEELTRVSGIGPAKAKELIEEKITSIDLLRQNTDKLTHHQIIGLKYLDDFEQKIPRSEIVEIEKKLREEISKLDDKYRVTICGSYRRGKNESGDIDALISHPDFTSKDKKPTKPFLESVVNTLKNCNLITDTISLGDVKFMGACKISNFTRRLDIRFTPFDQYYCAILYFTGSDMFNKAMRTHALTNNFTLNEYCIRPIGSTGTPGEPLPVSSEEDIFDYIDYPYKTPQERNI
ncbi:DNA polymerase beta-like [Planococcus citri]|uniref:DNA polymerase beta-like n=1 Tax=Planococcus citri TaxID=170843 RepID=UPI0031F92BF3